MRILKILLGLIFFIILVTAALSLILPDNQQVKKSITIKATAPAIYNELKSLENFNRVAVWSHEDSTASFRVSGTDGTVGASTSWEGHPMISGEGKITINELVPGKKIVHRVDFSQPKKGTAYSTFDFQETNKNETTVNWTFKVMTPRPWNIFNLLYSLDKERGEEFEKGLNILKSLMERRDSL